MGVITWDQAIDIGGGRGRLAPAPAASLARVDRDMRSAFGRAADINEAWRSPQDADRNYAAYLAYLRDPRNNPWAPIALPGDKSVHCFGYAVDTDDTSAAQMRIWNDHGWRWTVYRNGELVERWHLEYFAHLDNHRNDPAPAGTNGTPTPKEWDEMASKDDLRAVVAEEIRNTRTNEHFIVSYASQTDRNGIVLAGFGYWHKLTAEEWEHFNWLKSNGGLTIFAGLHIFTPINDRSYDILRDVCLNDGVAEGEGGVTYEQVKQLMESAPPLKVKSLALDGTKPTVGLAE